MLTPDMPPRLPDGDTLRSSPSPTRTPIRSPAKEMFARLLMIFGAALFFGPLLAGLLVSGGVILRDILAHWPEPRTVVFVLAMVVVAGLAMMVLGDKLDDGA